MCRREFSSIAVFRFRGSNAAASPLRERRLLGGKEAAYAAAPTPFAPAAHAGNRRLSGRTMPPGRSRACRSSTPLITSKQ